MAKKSAFNFDALKQNPVFEVATSANNVLQVKDFTLGQLPQLQPALNYGRVSFYTSISPTIAPRFRINGFGAGAATAIPVYFSGEMTMIKAEVYARQHDSTACKIFLNAVLTKNNDPFGVHANQQAKTGVGMYANLFDQIYRNRCIELYMSRLMLEDMRRFGKAECRA